MTYVLGVGIVYFIVQSTRKAWDYAVTFGMRLDAVSDSARAPD